MRSFKVYDQNKLKVIIIKETVIKSGCEISNKFKFNN